jgi:D-alanyl-D-alanine carboxypeptidase
MTASEYAIPGTSEHNAGLAIDFNLTDSPHTLIEESFDQTSAFCWLSENAQNYGFILRYPKNTIHITGIVYEPWHFRFVGVYHAQQIYISGLTLEEYIGVCADDDSAVNAWKRQLGL